MKQQEKDLLYTTCFSIARIIKVKYWNDEKDMYTGDFVNRQLEKELEFLKDIVKYNLFDTDIQKVLNRIIKEIDDTLKTNNIDTLYKFIQGIHTMII